ncbi:hypothetical protein EXIGLDRAFT_769109 [Exidia glandulosa HHB12029]|uniref:DUF6534 domain-containing protein n=1 Tax=Exidia glandulosa HHB12029 TaxID=1314781 RepID=A0A165HR84_EXIGL|nr:hypothetical protein EXIGLDRAFT_769109 [Exidia glandulosa HHB12029]
MNKVKGFFGSRPTSSITMSVEPPRLSAPDPAATIALLMENVSSLGSIEVGASVSMLFLGVAILQTWNYYRDFPKDPSSLKTLVAVLIILEIVHSILFVHATYHYTIAGLVDALSTGDPTFLVTTPWSLQTMVAVEAVTVILVQAYYCHRIFLITSSHIIALSCLLLAITRFGLSIALLVTDIVNPTIAVVHSPTFAWEAITAISVGAFSDLFIAACMCGGLLRRRTGFVGSNRLVDRLVGYILASGVATSIASLAQLIVYFAMPTTCKARPVGSVVLTAQRDRYLGRSLRRGLKIVQQLAFGVLEPAQA